MATSMLKEVEMELRKMKGNDKCVDCSSNGPQWASVSYGVFMCLECSGKHRGLGVHISFVRSVSMDAWKDREIRAMREGGNDRLIAHFRKFGVDKLPIVAKYNSPAAAMYREIVLALREGRAPPTDIKPFEDEVREDEARALARASGSGGSGGSGNSGFGNGGGGGGGGGGGFGSREGSANSGSSGGGGDREARARADALRERQEAQERLAAKFGADGLKGQSIGSASMGGMDAPSRNSGGGGGGMDDLLGVDITAHSQRVAALAGTAFKGLFEASKVGARAVADSSRIVARSVAESSQDLSRRVQESGVQERITGAMSGAVAAVGQGVAKPEAALGSLWKWSSGLVNSASTFVATQLVVPPGMGEGVSGGSDSPYDGGGAAAQKKGEQQRRRAASGEDSPSSSAAAAAVSAAAAAAAAAPPVEDNDEWMSKQVAEAQARLAGGAAGGGGGGGRPPIAPAPAAAASRGASGGAAAKAGGWDAWLDEDGEGSSGAAAVQAEPAPARRGSGSSTGSATAKPSRLGAARRSGSADGGSSTSVAAEKKPGPEDDDFFAKFGL